MTDYGVLSSGFNRKPLAVILAEIEAANIEVFGPGLIQTAQTPMGQLNGLRADLLSQVWESFEDVYQSYDPDQAEDTRLDTLARLRLISRTAGELDESLRQAITNAGAANTRDADFYRAILNVSGVTWAKIHVNDDDATDANGQDAHSVCVAVIGGDDEAVATTARQFIVPGIGSYGNTPVPTEIDGVCRNIFIMRPTDIPIFLELDITKTNGDDGCPPPSNNAIAAALQDGLSGSNRPANGRDITEHMIRTVIAQSWRNVEVTAIQGARVGDTATDLPISIDFDEIASIDLDNITITAA
ncbi:hypothetical protein JET14_13205 [Martelella lutilitoris]|uniref:Baseplate protein J-like domain-containing protein n=1 Tax=Martelella lutilitoris TaxID=2583532 RepID=A0A7T7KK28_9HYPH|nr:hypothetical protein [Martelella lutilitoris]QQM29285.1 hypothetical protein JET14_13205 [Martelella lutilitoris]